jgi:uncharacterized protein (DUF2267 family)
MARIYLESLNITLRGHPPERAEQLAAELPGAIEAALARPNEAPQGLAGEVARQVVAELTQQPGGDA